MVYLGPIVPRPVSVKAPSRPSATTAMRAYAQEHKNNERSAGLDENGLPIALDRRKQKDRRNKAKNSLLDSRAGRDRRKAHYPPINISI